MQLTEVVSTVHLIMEMLNDIKPILISIGVFLAFLLIRIRTGSSSIMLERIWRLLGGARNFKDPVYKEHWSQASDFEKYRYKTGIRFKSRAKIADTMAWLKAHDVGLEELLPLSRFFDPVGIDMRNPKLDKQKQLNILAGLIGLVWTCFCLTFAFYPMAVLTVRASNFSFVATPDDASPVFSSAWHLSPDNCGVSQPGIGVSDQKAICDMLNSGLRTQYIATAVKSQRIGAASLITSCFIVLFGLFLSYLKHIDAHHLYLRTRVEKKPQRKALEAP